MRISSPLLAAGSLPRSQGNGRERLAQAARQFEAIFVRQILAEARKSHFGGGLFDEGNPDSAIGTFNRMQDEHVADLAAERGAFGLAKMIEAQLSAQLGVGDSARASTGSAGAGVGLKLPPPNSNVLNHIPAPVPAQAEPVEAPSSIRNGSAT